MRIENLDHLGIVAGICDRIGLVERVDERLGTSPDELASSGQVLKAMILNGLGFLSAPMYLFPRCFFEGKPTEHLIGEGVKPEHLNDDELARVLDKLHEAGLTTSLCSSRSRSEPPRTRAWAPIGCTWTRRRSARTGGISPKQERGRRSPNRSASRTATPGIVVPTSSSSWSA